MQRLVTHIFIVITALKNCVCMLDISMWFTVFKCFLVCTPELHLQQVKILKCLLERAGLGIVLINLCVDGYSVLRRKNFYTSLFIIKN